MFKMTHEWLMENYGSEPHQVEDTRKWLETYGKDVSEGDIDVWSQYKHLAEYQVNTPTIIPAVLNRVDFGFASELEAHKFINILRVPNAAQAYMQALILVNPKHILELGVGGDSAISTAIFLYHVNRRREGKLISIDYNPLGKTAFRYGKYDFWTFLQEDSVAFLKSHADTPSALFGIRSIYDMIFIDTIHSYEHTLEELKWASKITRVILMDDATFEGNEFDEQPGGVKRAIKEWLEANSNWRRTDYANGTVSLLRRGK
jgi:predicted O-methyltransferase YrrM